MDTKWKNRKRILSFLVFFLGVSLTLGGLGGILREKPSDVRIWEIPRLLEGDYQESDRFRAYISNRLENLLIMATGGEGLLGIWGYGNDLYYSDSYEEGYLDDGSSVFWRDNMPDLGYEVSEEQIKPLTEEQRQEIAHKYHDSIKDDRNLLYTVLYDGKVLYSNEDFFRAADGTGSALSTAYGDIAAPEGYNFLLYFDGEKVSILKDGREVDVYGDGYYREEGGWYVPGYKNFQADGSVKKAAVCMAVAKAPVLYAKGAYGKGGTLQYDNSLYWMNQELQGRRDRIRNAFLCLAAGAALLLASFLCRKSRREAAEGIARVQARVWLECKILLFLAMLYALFIVCLIFVTDGAGYSLWEEMQYAYDYDPNAEALSWFGRELMGSIPPLLWIMLFWGLWLVWNDLHYNKKLWRCSLTAKLCHTFSAKSMDQPLPRKMSRRSRLLFIVGLVYAALMLEQVALVDTLWTGEHARTIVCLLAALETLLFLAVLYLTLKKNMKAARDMEALSRRITEIRNGDYGEGYGGGPKIQSAGEILSARPQSASVPQESAQNDDGHSPEAGEGTPGHSPESCGRVLSHEPECGPDLQPVMAQLEDIRHGMAQAVDEQMKSERMKVELIANVSHDIKTPLTSIISYVEILKQEEGLPDYVRDYIKILDEKSQRLKNMVTDVFAVSKAASGELPMQMEELDFGKLLRQTLADMEEQIQDSDVAFRTDLPQMPVMIMADGQRMYRVFQNLFQNAIKYSLQGSRVYVALKADGHLAVASVKNTSSQELEKGKDFAERFTRGDKSRTDGGSGLGLSIAQSFTEACGGQFSWETDADLFIVKIAFKVVTANHTKENKIQEDESRKDEIRKDEIQKDESQENKIQKDEIRKAENELDQQR